MFQAAVIFLIIPVLGYFVSFAIITSSQNTLDESGQLVLAQICSSDLLNSIEYSEFRSELTELCDIFSPIFLLQKASIVSGIVAIFLLVLFNLCASYASTDRNKIALIFPILVPFTVLIIAGQVLVQGIIFAYVSYIGPVELAGFYYPLITFGLAFGAAIGCFLIISSLSAFFKKPEYFQRGKVLTKESSPKIWDRINNIAKKIDATPPSNLVVGLEPTFYATATNVKVPGENEHLKGETLFLSLPLMKLFAKDELDAVIGHELGHFKGEDTNYSTKFTPIYANLSTSISNLSEGGSIVVLPAIYVLSYMYETFASKLGAVSREREFEADKIGIQASSKEGLVYALSKIATFSSLWNQTTIENIKRLNQGNVTSNLSEVFRESSLYNIGIKDINEIQKEILSTKLEHPTDSHPPMSERFENIEFDKKELLKEKIIIQGHSDEYLIDNIDEIEEDLTTLEHQWFMALGIAKLPEERNTTSDAFHIIYLLAAALIGADGKLEPEEVKVAEELGTRLLPDFDRVDFRYYINNLDAIPDFIETASPLAVLENETKNSIYEYLEAIAKADNDFADEEKDLLDRQELSGIYRNWCRKQESNLYQRQLS